MADPTPHPIESLSEREREKLRLFGIERAIHRIFPQFNYMDEAKFLDHDHVNNPIGNLDGTGQLLPFFTEQGREKTDPRLLLIFRPEGFAVNYYNIEGLSDDTLIRIPNNSFFGPRDNGTDRRWRDEEIEFALEKAKIHMGGVHIDDPKFLSQIAEWSGTGYITMGDVMQQKKDYFALSPKKRPKESPVPARNNRNYLWNFVKNEPQGARALAIARIQSQPFYTTIEGEEIKSDNILKEIEDRTVVGRKALHRELYKTDAYRDLLRNKGFL